MTWLSTLKFLIEEGSPRLHNVQSLTERRPVEMEPSEDLPPNLVEVYFTPGFLPQKIIESYMDAAKRTLDIAIYSWTLPSLAQAAIRAKERGVVIRVVMDRQQGLADYAVTDDLVDGGIGVVLDEQSGLQHNKYMVIDDKAVLTGSYNWSRAATARNRENFLVIRIPAVVRKYKENFEEIWRTNRILRRTNEETGA
jgi:phosphatidylserine/phosphatidylglycerophosphate/cardiolipin synthase-like enzyme